jgi:hypothetical protein
VEHAFEIQTTAKGGKVYKLRAAPEADRQV